MSNTVKMARSSMRAKSIYDRLMALPRPDDMSNNEWAKRAGVNTSFFTNLRKGSEPSVGNLRMVLDAIGFTLPEFFVSEANGRLVRCPTVEEVEAAIHAVLPGLPRNPDKRAQYLAESVLSVLELQKNHPANVVTIDFVKQNLEREERKSLASKNSTESSLPRTG